MKPDDHDKLGSLLEADELAGISFYESKQKLIKLGYTEDDISIAVASHGFDGKSHTPEAPNSVTEIYEKDPVLASGIAASLMGMDAEKRRLDTQLNVAQVAAGSLLHTANPYTAPAIVSLADGFGFPLFRLTALGVFLSAVVYGIHTFGLFGINWFIIFIYLYSFLLGLSFLICMAVADVRWIMRGAPMGRVNKLLYYGRKIVKYAGSLALIALVIWRVL